MKVGTDGVLLGAWVNPVTSGRILDIGTGTGLIALMLAQRTPPSVPIDAVEIQEAACQDASVNFSRSPWADRLHLHATDVRTFVPPHPYALIVSNPPWFHNSLKPPVQGREISRHSDALPLPELIQLAARWLTPDGRLALVLPAPDHAQLLTLAMNNSLTVTRSCTFITRPGKPPERLLAELSKSPVPATHEVLYLYDTNGRWSDDYQRLTGGFYLKR